MTDGRRDPIRVLFVCSGNSARSIMAEALLRQHGGDAFEVHSAGTEPRGINPLTQRVLADAGIDASWARSKSVDEYLGQTFDYVVTVCDQARQSCPVFPGVHQSLHWGYDVLGGRRGHRRGAFGRLPQGLHPDRRAGPAVLHRHSAAAPPGLMLLHLLRHAHAGNPEAWNGPDAARPLSEKGRDQARAPRSAPRRRRVQGGRDHHLAKAACRPDCGRP